MKEAQPAVTPDYHALLRQALAADPGTAAQLRATLTPLEAYDREQGGDLVHTLAVYFREGANLSRAATALFLHRNSLYYRLDHIQALTGLSLSDETHRLWLHLAITLITTPEEKREETTDAGGPPETEHS
jgi:DNA-binding PucR family transcriptional regulator